MDHKRICEIKSKITKLECTAPTYLVSKDDFFEIRDLVYFLYNEYCRLHLRIDKLETKIEIMKAKQNRLETEDPFAGAI
jgi:hypothetical protein